MNFSLQKITKYCEEHSSSQSTELYDLERETNLKTLAPQMMSGHLLGAFFKMLSCIKQPKNILEIGTFTGYTAICLAQGLQEKGMLHTIEANEELEYIIKNAIQESGLTDKIRLHIGDAKNIVPTLQTTFDIVFIDAGKRDYADYYDLVIDKVNKDGLILVDNVLWSGKVCMQHQDNDTRIIHTFNEKIQQDNRVENVMLPIRDGILIVKKL